METITKYDIAANIELSGLDGFSGKMKAAEQRRLFGGYIFGRKTITIDATNQGKVLGSYSVSFGADQNSFEFSFEEISSAALSGRGLSF